MRSEQEDSRREVVATAVAVEGGLAVVALLLGWLFGVSPLAQIEWTLRGTWQGVAAAVPMFALLVVVTRWPLGPLAGLSDVVSRAVVPLFRSCSLFDLAVICALAGLGEEMLFRGFVQSGLEQAGGAPWLALVAASVLFGLAHPITPTYVVLAALIGLYLGWLLMASGNLLVPIVTHAAYDLAALVYLLGVAAPPGDDPTASEYGDEWSL